MLVSEYGGEVMRAAEIGQSGLCTGCAPSRAAAGVPMVGSSFSERSPPPAPAGRLFPGRSRSGGAKRATRGFTQRLGGKR
jgi:hypothetical protein